MLYDIRRESPRAFRWSRQLVVLAVVALLSGCVREKSSGDVLVFNYRWWTALYAVAPLVFAGLVLSRHPTTWMNGVWRPWWTFRRWHHLELIRFGGALVFALIGPLVLFNRVEIGRDYLQESHGLGLRATRRIVFNDLSRIDVKSDAPGGNWTPDKDKEHDKKPDLIAVRKDGQTEEFRGWLINAAKPALLERARAAGVRVMTTDDPGVAPAGAGPGAAPWPDFPRGRGAPRGPWGER